ncbi:hypothetical protein KZO85_04115 [Chromohalobacter canadensis]|uniref:DUF6314 family protein n=1 Tax=Chromohalobacter canadensis TaxID=141389 RepID=UPI0021C09FB2|nr:DUF6314 family protein [Chromohalobacter canadensis]MCT8467759.1 hypothetical protein [Chromohalobacter canadensis]MCT8470493.1 hypothetical protein [Chromohalobacter canadensis]MCT8498256.1 hypothetical protein [Chromohalobacter canadensis]
MTTIIRLARLLPSIHLLSFTSRSGSASGVAWSGQGSGTVAPETHTDWVRFTEHGHFLPQGQSREVAFRNVYRWDLHPEHIALYHERRGPDAAVWLFDLVADSSTTLISKSPHLCGADTYQARLTLEAHGFRLEWHIAGPRKDERLVYHYRQPDE